MIASIFHQGSGLGNQLHRYVATRVLATDKGYEFGMKDIELFKGKSFMPIQFGNFKEEWGDTISMNYWNEKKVVEYVPIIQHSPFKPDTEMLDIRPYDPEINFVEDNTVIDGEFQDPRYFEHRLPEIDTWLAVEPFKVPDDACVIGFRGGEYTIFPDLFLTKDYWDEGIAKMREINPTMRFEVHTDDPITAQQFFPDFPIIHDVGINWRSMRFAKYAIIANSSFYILPRLLSGGVTLAPRYWARHNTKVWALPQNYYKQFTYL